MTFFACDLRPLPPNDQIKDDLQEILRPDGILKDAQGLERIKKYLSNYIVAVNTSNTFEIVYNGEQELITMKISSNGQSKLILNAFELHIKLDFYRDKFSQVYTVKKNAKIIIRSLNELCVTGHVKEFFPVFYYRAYIPAVVTFKKPTYQPNSVLSIWKFPQFFFGGHNGSRKHNPRACPYIPFYRKFGCILREYSKDLFGIGDMDFMKPVYNFFLMIFNLCEKNERLFKYVVSWLAYVTFAGAKTETGLFFYSMEQGIGKSLLFKIMSHLVNTKNVPLTNFKSKFFTPYSQTSLLVFEESSGSEGNINSNQVVEAFKNIITNDCFTTEAKFKDPIQQKNYVSVAFTTNVLPTSFVSLGDRRYVLLRCDPEKQDDKQFYEDIGNAFKDPNDTQFNENWDDYRGSLDFIKMDICDRCEKEEIEPPGNYNFAALSIVLMEIYARDLKDGFVPHKNVPLTKLHYELQLATNTSVKVFSTFIVRKSNNFYINRGDDWRCDYPGCDSNEEEHFDPAVPDRGWNIKHLKLDLATIIDSKFKDTEIMLDKTLNISRTYATLTPYYSFPTYEVLNKWIVQKLNLKNREIVFDLAEFHQ